ncbi:MAG: hypothetical protein KME26_31865 [Oscillatoria princeps RMCB-10]|nr:hypothetical protein [Oscillatoria princeps RMCB-10]
MWPPPSAPASLSVPPQKIKYKEAICGLWREWIFLGAATFCILSHALWRRQPSDGGTGWHGKAACHLLPVNHPTVLQLFAASDQLQVNVSLRASANWQSNRPPLQARAVTDKLFVRLRHNQCLTSLYRICQSGCGKQARSLDWQGISAASATPDRQPVPPAARQTVSWKAG